MNLFLLLVSAIYIVSVSSSSIPGPGQEGKRLIQTSEVEPAQWLTEGEIFDLIQENRGFVDITNFEYTSVSKKKPIVTGKIGIMDVTFYSSKMQRIFSFSLVLMKLLMDFLFM